MTLSDVDSWAFGAVCFVAAGFFAVCFVAAGFFAVCFVAAGLVAAGLVAAGLVAVCFVAAGFFFAAVGFLGFSALILIIQWMFIEIVRKSKCLYFFVSVKCNTIHALNQESFLRKNVFLIEER